MLCLLWYVKLLFNKNYENQKGWWIFCEIKKMLVRSLNEKSTISSLNSKSENLLVIVLNDLAFKVLVGFKGDFEATIFGRLAVR